MIYEMIYEFKDSVVHMCKSFRHWFRKLLCKHYHSRPVYKTYLIESCDLRNYNGYYDGCNYWSCPIRKQGERKE